MPFSERRSPRRAYSAEEHSAPLRRRCGIFRCHLSGWTIEQILHRGRACRSFGPGAGPAFFARRWGLRKRRKEKML